MNDLVREGRRAADEWHGWYAGGTPRMPSRPGCEWIEQTLRDLADALEAAEREKAVIIARFGDFTKREAELERELEAAEKVFDAALAAWEKTRDLEPIPDPPLTRSEVEQIREIDRKMKRRRPR